MIAFYHQTKIPISFWCKRGLNTRSLIQPSETLPVELTGTHIRVLALDVLNGKYLVFKTLNIKNTTVQDISNAILK